MQGMEGISSVTQLEATASQNQGAVSGVIKCPLDITTLSAQVVEGLAGLYPVMKEHGIQVFLHRPRHTGVVDLPAECEQTIRSLIEQGAILVGRDVKYAFKQGAVMGNPRPTQLAVLNRLLKPYPESLHYLGLIYGSREGVRPLYYSVLEAGPYSQYTLMIPCSRLRRSTDPYSNFKSRNIINGVLTALRYAGYVGASVHKITPPRDTRNCLVPESFLEILQFNTLDQGTTPAYAVAAGKGRTFILENDLRSTAGQIMAQLARLETQNIFFLERLTQEEKKLVMRLSTFITTTEAGLRARDAVAQRRLAAVAAPIPPPKDVEPAVAAAAEGLLRLSIGHCSSNDPAVEYADMSGLDEDEDEDPKFSAPPNPIEPLFQQVQWDPVWGPDPQATRFLLAAIMLQTVFNVKAKDVFSTELSEEMKVKVTGLVDKIIAEWMPEWGEPTQPNRKAAPELAKLAKEYIPGAPFISFDVQVPLFNIGYCMESDVGVDLDAGQRKHMGGRRRKVDYDSLVEFAGEGDPFATIDDGRSWADQMEDDDDDFVEPTEEEMDALYRRHREVLDTHIDPDRDMDRVAHRTSRKSQERAYLNYDPSDRKGRAASQLDLFLSQMASDPKPDPGAPAAWQEVSHFPAANTKVDIAYKNALDQAVAAAHDPEAIKYLAKVNKISIDCVQRALKKVDEYQDPARKNARMAAKTRVHRLVHTQSLEEDDCKLAIESVLDQFTGTNLVEWSRLNWCQDRVAVTLEVPSFYPSKDLLNTQFIPKEVANERVTMRNAINTPFCVAITSEEPDKQSEVVKLIPAELREKKAVAARYAELRSAAAKMELLPGTPAGNFSRYLGCVGQTFMCGKDRPIRPYYKIGDPIANVKAMQGQGMADIMSAFSPVFEVSDRSMGSFFDDRTRTKGDRFDEVIIASMVLQHSRLPGEEGFSDLDQVMLNLAWTFNAKPKKELTERSKAFNKQRNICSANTIVQAPLQLLIHAHHMDMYPWIPDKTAFDMPVSTFLGCDPVVELKNLVHFVRFEGGDKVTRYRSYSDNLYGLEKGVLYSFDVQKAESFCDTAVLEQTVAPLRVYQEKIEPFFLYFDSRTTVQELKRRLDACTGELNADYREPGLYSLMVYNESVITMKDLDQVMEDCARSYYRFLGEPREETPGTWTQAVSVCPPAAVRARIGSYLTIMAQVVEKGRVHMGTHSWPVPGLPSGVACTAQANTTLTASLIPDLRKRGITPTKLSKNLDEALKFCVLTCDRPDGADLRLKGADLAVDFLGLNIEVLPYSAQVMFGGHPDQQVIMLRRESLDAGLSFNKIHATDSSPAGPKWLATYMSYLAMGLLWDPLMWVPITKLMAGQSGTSVNPSELALYDEKMAYLVQQCVDGPKAGFWKRWALSALDRYNLSVPQDVVDKMAEAFNDLMEGRGASIISTLSKQYSPPVMHILEMVYTDPRNNVLQSLLDYKDEFMALQLQDRVAIVRSLMRTEDSKLEGKLRDSVLSNWFK